MRKIVPVLIELQASSPVPSEVAADKLASVMTGNFQRNIKILRQLGFECRWQWVGREVQWYFVHTGDDETNRLNGVNLPEVKERVV